MVGRSLHPTQRTALCRKALQACTSADPHAHALADAPAATGDDADAEKALAERNLNFQVQWTNMSSGPPDRSGGSSVIDHGWLNVLNLSVACAETGFTAGDVVVAVAMRNMLPEASTCSGTYSTSLIMMHVGHTYCHTSDSHPLHPMFCVRSVMARLTR